MLKFYFVFQGLEEFKKTVLRNTIVKLSSVVCIFLFVKNVSDLNKYFLIYVLSTLIIIISPILVFIGLSNIIGLQYLLPTKQQKEFTISVTIGALVNFCLNMILIRLCQSVGATIATVVAECVVTGVQFWVVREKIKFWDVVNLSKKYIISSIVMFGGSLFVGCVVEDLLLSIIVQVIVAVIIYFGFLLLLKDKLVIEGIEKVKNKLK